ncbi:MAG: hypothetical protein P8Y80_08135 [Acidobacteriota bacterium]
MRIPSIALVLSEFYEQETEKALHEGMPNVRTQWVLGPTWAKTREQIRKDVINGVNPISGRPVMQEIVEKLTKPLSEEDTKTGTIERTKGPLTYTDTEENLQHGRLFRVLDLHGQGCRNKCRHGRLQTGIPAAASCRCINGERGHFGFG